MESVISTSKLREIILNARRPLVLRNFQLPWKCFDKPINEWCESFDKSSEHKKLPFQRMSRMYRDSPQWERNRTTVELTCKEFLEQHLSIDQPYWSAFNYHRVDEIPLSCKEGINFSIFGFSSASDDCTFWLSSSGANTPCHYDTYGCNIVVQIYGRKSWLLFPPGTPLSAVRLPYEESSVYCKENFYSPKNVSFENICAYHYVLDPKDVLIVPKNWWHYVESVDVSLSVNSWIPLEDDKEAQIEECIVKFLMERFSKEETPDCQRYILNPNQLQLLTEEAELLEILQFLITSREITNGTSGTDSYRYQYLMDSELDTLRSEFSAGCITEVPQLSCLEFKKIIQRNSSRYDETFPLESFAIRPIKEVLLNTICSPNVIKIIKKEIFSNIK